MKLSQILPALTQRGDEITSVTADSRKAGAGTVFFCLPGARTDGHRFAPQAYAAGCRIFVASRQTDLPADAEVFTVPSTPEVLADAAARFYRFPARELTMIGITGTKGKSTVSAFIYDILREAGIPAGIIGTAGVQFGERHIATENTTPDALTLHRLLREMAESGVRTVVMEVSSQSYLTHRVDGITFDIGVFTNLSPDHIGAPEHPDFENYKSCKARLFANSRLSIVNADDPHGADMTAAAAGEKTTYGFSQKAGLRAFGETRFREGDRLGMRFSVAGADGDERRFELAMPGIFNVANALAAISVARELGIDDSASAAALAGARVCGRTELVSAPPGRIFMIDYAHNALSLRAVLGELRAYSPRRLIALFGSVGGRTQMRRAELGAVAGELCDEVILTADNPDGEDVTAICREIAEAVGDCPCTIIPDRAEAVRFAVEHSAPGDTVLFAGKGHEEYQLVGGVKLPYSDSAAIAAAVGVTVP